MTSMLHARGAAAVRRGKRRGHANHDGCARRHVCTARCVETLAGRANVNSAIDQDKLKEHGLS